MKPTHGFHNREMSIYFNDSLAMIKQGELVWRAAVYSARRGSNKRYAVSASQRIRYVVHPLIESAVKRPRITIRDKQYSHTAPKYLFCVRRQTPHRTESGSRKNRPQKRLKPLDELFTAEPLGMYTSGLRHSRPQSIVLRQAHGIVD
jgi:hypothetical protein